MLSGRFGLSRVEVPPDILVADMIADYREQKEKRCFRVVFAEVDVRRDEGSLKDWRKYLGKRGTEE